MMQLWIHYINEQTEKHNQNNVSRTKAYLDFYDQHPEVCWAFLAGVVSRNAGWNMTDLKTETFQNLLSKQEVKSLYLTYESANWYIFQDAYPQLLIYQLSLEQNRPMFFLLKYFHVSTFMEEEWYHFYRWKNKERLLYAQIINEQNLIQHPIIEQDPYDKKVFKRLPFHLQEILHMNAVLLPTLKGELYGGFVPRFKNVTKRIDFGKRIATILFDTTLHQAFKQFSDQVRVTGSRAEYENKLPDIDSDSPTLEQAFSMTNHHLSVRRTDWKNQQKVKKKWFAQPKSKPIEPIGHMFYQKRKWLASLTETMEQTKSVFVEKK